MVIQNALFLGWAKAGSLVIPWATYTSPELARVGLNESEASEQGIAVDTFTQEMAKVDRAILDGSSHGFVRVHVRRGTDEIVGATVVSPHAGELIGELTLALRTKVGLRSLGATIHPYPTEGEAVRKLGDFYNQTRLTPRVRSLMRLGLDWQR